MGILERLGLRESQEFRQLREHATWQQQNVERIAAMENDLAETQNRTVGTCPRCGGGIGRLDVFCGGCGAPA